MAYPVKGALQHALLMDGVCLGQQQSNADSTCRVADYAFVLASYMATSLQAHR